MAEEVLYQVILGVKRRKGVEPRFFQLFADRLVYFKTEAEANAGSEPRGHLNFDDILDVVLHEDGSGFSIYMQSQSLELASEGGNDVRPLYERLGEAMRMARGGGKSPQSPGSPVRGPPVMEGNLGVERRGKVTQRYFFVYADALEYFEDARDKDSQNPRGRIMLEDVERIAVGGTGLSISIRGEKRPLELRAPSEAEMRSLATALASLGVRLEGQYGEESMPSPSPRKGPTRQMQGVPLGASLDRPLIDGVLSVIKKGKSDVRQAVLFRDRFEYYNTVEDFRFGATPRCRVPLNQLIDMASTADGLLRLHLEDRTIDLQPPVEDRDRWEKAWMAMGFLASGSAGARHGVPGAGALAATLQDDGSARKRTPSSPRRRSPSPTREAANTPTPQAPEPTPPTPPPEPVKKGAVDMKAGRSTEPRYLVLYPEHLELFNTEREHAAGEKARATYAANALSHAQAAPGGFSVELDSVPRTFLCPKPEAKNWVDAITASGQLASSSQLVGSSPRSGAPDLLLAEGTLSVARKGKGAKTENKLCRLYPNRLEHAADAAAFANGAAQLRPFSMLTKFDVLPQEKGFSLTFTDGEALDLLVPSGQIGKWLEGWKSTQGVASAASLDMTALSSTKAPGSARGSPKASPKGKDGKGAGRGGKAAPPPDPNLICDGEVQLERLSKNNTRGKVEPRTLALRKVEPPARGCMLVFKESPAGGDMIEVPLREIRAFKMENQGFGFSTSKRDFAVAVPSGINRWATAFKDAFKEEAAAEQQTKAASSEWASHSGEGVLPTRSKEAAQKGDWGVQSLSDPRLVKWLQVLRAKDPPVHHGLLGASPKGQLVTGYFVLFRDRLDFWNSPLEAASALKPRGRINLADVRSLETVSSGFVLNTKGHKLGLHVKNNDDLHQWSQALLSVLSPGAGGVQMTQSTAKVMAASGKAGGGASSASTTAGAATVGSLASVTEAGAGTRKMKLKLSEDVVARMYRALGKYTEQVTPQTQDNVYNFLNINKNGLLSPDDIIKLLQPPAKDPFPARLSVTVQAPEQDPMARDIHLLMQAMSDFVSSGQRAETVSVAKLAEFIISGASGIPGISRTRAILRSRSWVPRVATLTTADSNSKSKAHAFQDPEELVAHKISDIFKKRAGGKAFKTGKDTTRLDGGSWLNSDVAGKVHLTHPDGSENVSPQIPVRSKSVDSLVKEPNPIVGERLITPRHPPGHIPWSKIVHVSQDVTADPQHQKKDTSRPTGEGCHRKVGEEDRKPLVKRQCLTGKVTDPDRQPLADKEFRAAQLEARMAPKPTESGRSDLGWAAPFSETREDFKRSLHEKVINSPRRTSPVIT